jgi:hypothetical protein
MILLTFLIASVEAHPCDSAFWKGKDAHIQCIVDQWNKHDDPLGLRKTPRYTEITPTMTFSQNLVLTPYHMDLWLEHKHKPRVIEIPVGPFTWYIRP